MVGSAVWDCEVCVEGCEWTCGAVCVCAGG